MHPHCYVYSTSKFSLFKSAKCDQQQIMLCVQRIFTIIIIMITVECTSQSISLVSVLTRKSCSIYLLGNDCYFIETQCIIAAARKFPCSSLLPIPLVVSCYSSLFLPYIYTSQVSTVSNNNNTMIFRKSIVTIVSTEFKPVNKKNYFCDDDDDGRERIHQQDYINCKNTLTSLIANGIIHVHYTNKPAHCFYNSHACSLLNKNALMGSIRHLPIIAICIVFKFEKHMLL